MPQSTTEKLGEFLGFILVLVYFAGWIGSGYVAWHWVTPESFGGGIGFILVWGILGTILQALIPIIVIPILMGLDALFSPSIKPLNHASNLPPTAQSAIAKKSEDNSYAGWAVVGFICLCGVAYFHEQSEKKYQSVYENVDNTSDTTPSTTNHYPKSPQPTAQCYDGTYSYSTGRQGTCSHHGGVKYWFTGSTSPSIVLPTPTTAPILTTTQSPTVEQTPVETIQAPTAPTETTADNRMDYAQAKAEFDTQIINLNQAWQKLQPDFRKSILTEQRAFNQQRETKCQEYSLTVTGDSIQQATVALLCQVEALKKRTQYLQSQVNTIVTPPPTQTETPMNEEVKPVVEKETKVPTTEINPNKKAYNNAIAKLNQAWNQLTPDVREELRPEQRENNHYREAECRDYAISLEESQEQQESARLACEVPLIEERTEYLKQKIAPIELKVKGAG